MKTTFRQLASLFPADAVMNPAAADDRVIGRLLTDSRSLTDGADSLFFAITTPTGDGHRYIRELYRRGVRAFVTDASRFSQEEAATMPDALFIAVADTVAALQKTGATHRANAREVVAITGSRGKTTLKELLFQLLSRVRSVSRSPRSYNSQVGVPLSVWGIAPHTDIALIEAGVSQRGEMAPLRECIAPDTVIITNLGSEHSEGFSDDAEKAVEKVSLARDARCVIYCQDYPEIARAVAASRSGAPGRKELAWSAKDRDARLFVRREGDTTLHYEYEGTVHTLTAPVGSDAELENCANALALMLAEGFGAEETALRFAGVRHVGTRLSVAEGMNGCSLIEDTYTSDFSSLGPALDFMRRRASAGQSMTVIISDPDHEGASAEEEYREVARLLEMRHVSRLIGVGPGLQSRAPLFRNISGSRFFADTESLLDEMSGGDFVNEVILLKGAPGYGFGRIAQMLEARTHETVLDVNLDAVVENYNRYRAALPKGTGIVCMVKAAAYGAGSAEVASVLQDCGAAYMAVAVLDEGIELRRHGITMPVMVMNPRVASYAPMFRHRLEPVIYSPQMLEEVIREGERRGVSGYPIHIKIDTGMHRTGFAEHELPALMERIDSQEVVEIRSAFSHLATADCLDMDIHTLRQLETFDRATGFMLSKARRPFLRHILNSAGIIRFPQYHYDMARLGIGLYGVGYLPADVQGSYEVVSTLRTVVINVRDVEEGEAVGYARRGAVTHPSRIATIPIGYADGMNRRFGNGAISVMINGHECPTIGNICMDACMIDVTGTDVAPGDQVEIFGRQMPLERLSDLLGTIPYEILTSVSPRVKRIYSRG